MPQPPPSPDGAAVISSSLVVGKEPSKAAAAADADAQPAEAGVPLMQDPAAQTRMSAEVRQDFGSL